MKFIKSACPLDCWDACGFQVNSSDLSIHGDSSHPITQGFICKKGHTYLKDRTFSSKRIQTPLLKQGNTHIPIGWEQALDLFASKVQDALNTFGSRSIAHYYDSGAGGLLKSLEHRFFNRLGGITVPVGSLCWAAGIAAMKQDFGSYYCHHPQDMENSDTIIIWGRNITETNIHLLPYLAAAKKNQKTIIVIDPNKTEIARKADLYIQVEPATDGFLAIALIKVLMAHGIPSHLLDKANNFAALSNITEQYSLETLAAITGVSLQAIHDLAARLWAGRTTIYLGYGMQRYYNSGNTIRAINSLAYLSGNIGVAGGGVNYADSFVASHLNLKGLTLSHLAKHRYFPKPQFADYLLHAAEPPIKLLYISRANPVVTLPNTAKTMAAISSIDFVICSDIVHTDTTKLADLILPATTFLEEEDLIFSSMWHRYINYIHPVVAPVGEARPEWQVFTSLAERLNLNNFPLQSAREWLELAVEPLNQFGIDIDRLQLKSLSPTPETDIPWQNLTFATENGKFNLLDEKILLLEEKPGFPYLFMTPHPKDSIHSQFQDQLNPDAYPIIYLNPKLAEKEKITNGDLVVITSQNGQIEGEVAIADWVHHKVLFSYEGRPLKYGNTQNTLTDDGLTDIGNGTTMYQTYCTIHRRHGDAETRRHGDGSR